MKKYLVAFLLLVTLVCLTSCSSKDCIVSEKHDSIVYLDKKYVPLETGNLIFERDKILIDSASHENQDVFDYLFCGEVVYSVKGCNNLDLIYLQSEYDSMISNIFVLDAKQEKYADIVSKAKPGDMFSDIKE